LHISLGSFEFGVQCQCSRLPVKTGLQSDVTVKVKHSVVIRQHRLKQNSSYGDLAVQTDGVTHWWRSAMSQWNIFLQWPCLVDIYI